MSKTTKYPQGPLLSKINSPDDLRKLNKNQLEQISTELRQYIVDIVLNIMARGQDDFLKALPH